MLDYYAAYQDWAGPWPLEERALHGSEDGPLIPYAAPGTDEVIWGWLCLDYHGDLYPAGTFMVTMRRFVRQGGLVPDDGLTCQNRLAWDNGQILQADRDLALILCDEDADGVVAAVRTFVDSGGWREQQVLCQDGQVVRLQFGALAGVDPALLLWWSDFTQGHPWLLAMQDAAHFAGRLESLLSARRTYLDALIGPGYVVHAWVPDAEGPDACLVEPDEGMQVDDYEQATRIAESFLAAGACRVQVFLGTYPLVDLDLDDLTDEDRAVWDAAYGG